MNFNVFINSFLTFYFRLDALPVGICGLENKENNCYMNAILQYLSQIQPLMMYFVSNDSFFFSKLTDDEDYSKNVKIAENFSKLLKQIWSGKMKTVNPVELKWALESKYPVFEGHAHHDAHELLLLLLDSLHGAINRGIKKTSEIMIDESLTDGEKANFTWNWYTQHEVSVITEVFEGQLECLLTCDECSHTTKTYHPFRELR